MKESFVFYETWAEAIRQMPDKERLQVFDAIMAYGIYGAKTEIGGLAQMALNLVFNDIDDCKKKRNEKTEKARESANKRWQKANADECERIRTDANAYERKQTDATQCYNVNVNGNVNGDVNVNEKSPLNPPKGETVKQPKFNPELVLENEPAEKRELLMRWINYKKMQFRQTYKSDDSFKTFVKKLERLSGGNLETAKAIIEHSIANTYQGIFELKKSAPARRIDTSERDNRNFDGLWNN